MKTIKIFKAIFMCFIVLSGTALSHVGLDYPHGGETFEAGDTVTVMWQEIISHGDSNWDLLFTSNAGLTWENIVSDLPKSQLSFDWTVPNESSNVCRIRIVQDNIVSSDYTDDSGDFTITSSTGVDNNKWSVKDFALYPAYPNPFNPTTKISYSLPRQSKVSLKIYDMLGNEVKTLVDGTEPEGSYEFLLNASGWTSGVYFYKLQAVATSSDSRENFIQTKKLILLK